MKILTNEGPLLVNLDSDKAAKVHEALQKYHDIMNNAHNDTSYLAWYAALLEAEPYLMEIWRLSRTEIREAFAAHVVPCNVPASILYFYAKCMRCSYATKKFGNLMLLWNDGVLNEIDLTSNYLRRTYWEAFMTDECAALVKRLVESGDFGIKLYQSRLFKDVDLIYNLLTFNKILDWIEFSNVTVANEEGDDDDDDDEE